MEKYIFIKNLGNGTFGSVSKYRNNKTNEIVAIKKLKKKMTNWNECVDLPEIKYLIKLNHPNIIKLLEVIKSNDYWYLVFEYLENSILNVIKNSKNISEVDIRNLSFQIFQGLNFIHKKGYFHRDIKPENILEYNNIVKIADFGLCKPLQKDKELTEYISTRWYRAPELCLSDNNYNEKIDVFAVGCIISEIYQKSPLFPGKSQLDQLLKIVQILGNKEFFNWNLGVKLAKKYGFNLNTFDSDLYKGNKIKKIFSCYNKNLVDLLTGLLKYNPDERFSCEEALQHPYFQVRLINENYYVNNTHKEIELVEDEEDNNQDRAKKILKECKYKPGINLYEIYNQ